LPVDAVLPQPSPFGLPGAGGTGTHAANASAAPADKMSIFRVPRTWVPRPPVFLGSIRYRDAPPEGAGSMKSVGHIVLIGPMGSGKTTIGHLLANRLERPFVDNDTMLKQTSGRTAAEIARNDGVEILHAREAAVLRDALEEGPPAVVNAAASTVLDSELREFLRTETFVIWLTADPETLARRTATGPGSRPRPQLASDRLALAERQGVERDPFFAEVADLLVATDGPIDAAVDDIVANLPAGSVPPDADV
jgi:shikimate kinase